ncbi:uncharacterized protein KY384_007993 [Bacidia gigantensis]|uniref:uncharacterized protein n=1 Tax=Bacidia gigantensis TaxID=2732470 RepID=UPI001D054E33|nr:uncharacterized protein KY384_007993 [Bacidia gigantensis]KAG8527249.1 hypothetical protein KY384_007993 [Bacidia gigantensis]
MAAEKKSFPQLQDCNNDFSFNRNPWDTQFPRKSQEVTATSSVNNPVALSRGRFGAVCPDPRSHTFSKAVAIEVDGSIEDETSLYRRVFEVPGNETPISVGEGNSKLAFLAKAVGKIRMAVTDGTGDRGGSGFFIGHDKKYFMTCAHWIPPREIQGQANISPNHRPRVGREIGCHFVQAIEDWDVAIFAVDYDPKLASEFLKFIYERATSVPVDHLVAASSLDPKEICDRYAFSMGYYDEIDPTLISTHWDKCMNVWHQQATLRELGRPDYRDIFPYPGVKNIITGRLNSDGVKAESKTWSHCISGWHGLSGGLIAYLDKQEDGSAKPRIIGLFLGPLDSELKNEMAVFSSEVINQIAHIIQGTT